jgi:transposase
MLSLNENTRVFLKSGITDGRLGFYGLRGLVSQGLGLDVMGGDMFVFCNRRRNRISCLLYPETVIILTHDIFRLRPAFCDSITRDNSWSGSHLGNLAKSSPGLLAKTRPGTVAGFRAAFGAARWLVTTASPPGNRGCAPAAESADSASRSLKNRPGHRPRKTPPLAEHIFVLRGVWRPSPMQGSVPEAGRAVLPLGTERHPGARLKGDGPVLSGESAGEMEPATRATAGARRRQSVRCFEPRQHLCRAAAGGTPAIRSV